MYDQKSVQIANKTNRSHGSVGANAIVPRIVRQICTKEQTILDFGSGRLALHAQKLTDEGYHCTAHEFGANANVLHDPEALNTPHDVVYMSNVLNVQSSTDMLRKTLSDAFGALKEGGILIANYPQSPRKAGLSTKDMSEMLRFCGKVERVKSKGNVVFKVTK